jgi:hypothetical protein
LSEVEGVQFSERLLQFVVKYLPAVACDSKIAISISLMVEQ